MATISNARGMVIAFASGLLSGPGILGWASQWERFLTSCSCRRSQVQHDLASGSRPPRAHCCTACDLQAKFNWLFSCCQFFNLFSQTGTRPPAFLQPRLVLKPVSGSA